MIIAESLNKNGVVKGRVCGIGLLFCLALGGLGCAPEQRLERPRVDRAPLPSVPLIVDGEGVPGGCLHYPLPGEPSTFNFTAVQESRARLVTGFTTGTLFEFNPLEQRVVEGVAQAWEFSDDGRRLTLHLREGLKFSDGVPMTSADVVFTFQKIYQEDSRNTLKGTLLIQGRPLEVRALDRHTVQIGFPQPYAAAEYLMTTVPVLPRHRFEEDERKIEEYWSLATPPEQMAGLGPFVLHHHLPGEQSVFRFNPHYWKVDRAGVRLPYLDEVVLHYIEERNTQLLRFQACQLDLLDQLLQPEGYLELEAEQVNLVNAGPSSNLMVFWLNLDFGRDPQTGRSYLAAPQQRWFGDLKFRRALAHGINRGAMVRTVFLGHAQVARSFVPSSLKAWYAEDLPEHPYDPHRARTLLRQAGFRWEVREASEVLLDPAGRPVQFDILTRSDDLMGRIGAILHQDLEQLGMQVNLRQEEFRSVISRIRTRDYDAVILNIELPVEPADYGNLLLSSGPMHMWRPDQEQPATDWEAQVDQLMVRQMSSRDPSLRQSLFRQIQHIVSEQVPMIPLLHRDVLVAAKRNLRNLKASSFFPYGLWNIWEIWLAPDGN